jgi:tRNA splicing endonuclease
MKTENTLENKAKFFAQYWGQHVLYFSSDFLRKIDNLTLDSVENDDYLELKPLSQISDEDASKVCDLIFITNNNLNIQQIKQIVILIESNNWNNYKIFDYLRSKGYALPYMDLSVEDLIEYGWIKLDK